MTPNGLRYALKAFGLSQAGFARVIGVTPRSVMLWLSGKYEIPGPVDAYLRLLTAAPEAIRLSELQRIVGAKNAMKDGLYSVFFNSMTLAGTGIGIGALVLDGGKAYGGDPSGGKYDGDYIYDETTGLATVRLKVTFPPNGVAVFGESYPVEWSIDVTADIDPRLEAGDTSFVTPHGQKVDVQYKYLHGLPEG